MKLRSGKCLQSNTLSNIERESLEKVPESPKNSLQIDVSLVTDASLISDTSLVSSPSISSPSSEVSQSEGEQTSDEEEDRKVGDEDVSSYSTTASRSPSPHLYADPADNYDIADLASGDETDDEEAPWQDVPCWVDNLDAFLEHQFISLSYGEIFGPYPSPDLDLLFNTTQPRFKNRTSSAVWNKAPVITDMLADNSALEFSTLTIDELSE